MAVYSGELGLQFTTHIVNHYTVPQWIELAELARRNNFDQVWINDNLGYRNVFVILTAIASRVPIKLGTAILVPYFRNPVDAADAFAALSELVDGREISVGMARGDYAQAGNQINLVKPISMVKETVHCMKRLFEGKRFATGITRFCHPFTSSKKTRASTFASHPKRPFAFIAVGTARG